MEVVAVVLAVPRVLPAIKDMAGMVDWEETVAPRASLKLEEAAVAPREETVVVQALPSEAMEISMEEEAGRPVAAAPMAGTAEMVPPRTSGGQAERPLLEARVQVAAENTPPVAEMESADATAGLEAAGVAMELAVAVVHSGRVLTPVEEAVAVLEALAQEVL